MRQASIKRKTAETDIALTLDLDGTGAGNINTGCGFLNHMLTLFARHGGFDLTVTCVGDTDVDDHHTVEDVGICLGLAFEQALGDRRGITRYGDSTLPMDEALLLAAVDISGRGRFCTTLCPPTQKVGTFDTELANEFFDALASRAGMTVHLRQLAGENSHHIIEGGFKALARALKTAVAIDEKNRDVIPSTKGVL